jgi:hypothetical protein
MATFPAAGILSFERTEFPSFNQALWQMTMKRTAKWLNLLLSDFACALANKLLPAPVTARG